MNPGVAEILRRAKEIEARALPAAMGARMRARIEERLATRGGARRFVAWRWMVPVVSAAAAAGVVAMLVNGAVTAEFSSGDEARVVAVSDVAEATLAPESHVQVESAREVRLVRGAATFAVKKQPSGEAFRVVVGAVTVEVVGTVFEVRREPVRVRVSEGRVRVRSAGGEWMVGAGEAWPAVAVAGAGAEAGAGAGAEAVAGAGAGAGAEAVAGAEAGAGAEAEASAGGFERAAAMLAAGDVDGARREYVRLSRESAPSAETALYLLARLEARRAAEPLRALTALREMERRFPGGKLLRERDLSIVEALFALGRCAEAKLAAKRFRAAHGFRDDDDVELKPIPGGPCRKF